MSVPKFLLDENVSHKTLARLRRGGLTVESVRTLNLLGARNSELLEFATTNEFILITHDRDFLSPSQPTHCGIIVVLIHPKIDAHAGTILERFLSIIDLQKIKGRVVKLEETYWSIH